MLDRDKLSVENDRLDLENRRLKKYSFDVSTIDDVYRYEAYKELYNKFTMEELESILKGEI